MASVPILPREGFPPPLPTPEEEKFGQNQIIANLVLFGLILKHFYADQEYNIQILFQKSLA